MDEPEEQALESADFAVALHNTRFAEPIAILDLGATDIPEHAPIPGDCDSDGGTDTQRSGRPLSPFQGSTILVPSSPGSLRSPGAIIVYPLRGFPEPEGFNNNSRRCKPTVKGTKPNIRTQERGSIICIKLKAVKHPFEINCCNVIGFTSR